VLVLSQGYKNQKQQKDKVLADTKKQKWRHRMSDITLSYELLPTTDERLREIDQLLA
jgi:hypothetical protein